MWIVFSLLDKRAEQMGSLFTARNLAVGARMFSDAVLRGELKLVAQHPQDFALVQVGSFDEETGKLEPYSLNGMVVDTYKVVLEATEVLRAARDFNDPQLSLEGQLMDADLPKNLPVRELLDVNRSEVVHGPRAGGANGVS